MSTEAKPMTSAVNARLWSHRVRDRSELQERTVDAAYEAVIARTVQPGTRYLDVGCGAGMAAKRAADNGAVVSGIDASEALLEIARQRLPQGDFRVADLEQLPFDDAQFDVVTGFNAFQYAGNPIVALAEARRVTRPRGTVAVMTWGTPVGMPFASVITALGPLMPPPPLGAPGPFALSDEGALRAFAEAAELTPIDVIDVPSIIAYPDEATALRALNSSGVAARAIENTNEAAVSAAHRAALAPFRQADGSYRIDATFRCLFTRR
jgi:SAM-dependent methyltransferase